MHDSLNRLYRSNLALLAIILLVVGIALLIIGRLLPHLHGLVWTANLPIVDIGSGVFTTGLLAVGWQAFAGRVSDEQNNERIHQEIASSIPAMRDAVIQGFAFEPDDIARVSTPETLDRIVTNGLAIRLDDADLADSLYDDIRAQVIDQPERLYDARISIRLSPLPMGRGTPVGRASFFATTVRWEYRVKPTFATRRFVALSDIKEYRDLRNDTAATSAWYIGPRSGLDAADPKAFELVDFAVDGKPRPIRRSSKAGSQTYAVSLGEAGMATTERLTISYTYRTAVAVDQHLLQLRVDQPTRGLTVELDYGATGLDHVNALEYFGGRAAASVSTGSVNLPDRTITLSDAGWVYPRSGACFVWGKERGKE